MEEEAKSALPLETGGVLLGYWSEDRSEAVIADTTGPGLNAVHSKTEFIPDDEYQDRMIDDIYMRSGRQYTYLGDWHTHPFGDEALSYKDRRTLQRIATLDGTGGPAPLMAVLACNQQRWRLAIWRHRRPVTVIERITLRCTHECELVEYEAQPINLRSS